MIKVTNLNKYYNKGKNNEIHVINNVNLELPSTGLVSFLGESGSGKSTLLNVIGGLDKGVGEITYDDKVIKNYNMKKIDSFRRQDIGYVFQNYNLLLNETVYDNLRVALELIDIYDKDEQEKRIEYVLKMVGMYKYRKKKAYALSGGQQQRISIARALVKESKIIIADEPTGNLDRINTIQVMNILKSISKKSLVLMVTHNEEIASYYSDLIYKIKDGEVEEDKNFVKATSLESKENDTIYLEDKTKEELDNSIFSINLFKDKNNNEKLDLEIIEHNGAYFIKSNNKNIKLLEEANLKVAKKRPTKIEVEEQNDFTYDTTFFNESKGKRKIGKEMRLYMKESYNSISTMKKKTKFLYVSFFIIGILFAIAVCAFSNFTVIDKSSFEIDESYTTLTSNDFYSSVEESETLKNILNKNLIKDVNRVFYLNSEYNIRFNYNEAIDIEMTFPVLSYLDLTSNKYKLIKGEAPVNNEIVLSEKIAKNLVSLSKGYFKDIDDLIGEEIKLTKGNTLSKTVIISGINNNPYLMTYLPDDLYLQLLSDTYVVGLNQGVFIRDYSIEKKYNTYEIVSGRDLTDDDYILENSSNILLPVTYPDALDLVNTSVTLDGNIYNVVGVYKLKGLTNYFNEIIGTNNSVHLLDNEITSSISLSDYYLVDGKNPSSNNEVITSIYSKYNIGDLVDDTYTVVGKYSANQMDNEYKALYTRDSFVITNQIYSKCVFDVIDKDGVNEVLSVKQKYEINSTYDDIYKNTRSDQNMSLIIFAAFGVILVVVLVIFIYFLMKSRMISEIYPIGVYRSIGASKSRITLKFICDIFVTTSLTVVIGYLGFMILYGTIANTTNSFMNGMVLINSIPMTLIGILVLYLLTFIFGLIPIFSLLKKTPSEILGKYDI